MPSSYLNDLRLELQADGENASLWGQKLNAALTQIGDALAYGTQDCFATDANATTTVADGAADPARAMYFKVTSTATLTATRTLTIAPNTISRVMFIENATTGSQSITISQGSGSTVTIANGKTAVVYLDGAGATAAVVDAMAKVDPGVTDTLAEVLTAGNTTGGTSMVISSGDDVTFTGASANIVFDSSDSALEFADNAKAVFGAGSDLQIYHDGSNSYVKDAGTGNLLIQADNFVVLETTGGINYFQGQSGGASTVYHNGSAKLATTSYGVDITGRLVTTSHIDAPDDAKIRLGDGDDLQLYHDSTTNDSIITETGAGNLVLQGDSLRLTNTAGVRYLQGNSGAEVTLWHSGNKKLETTSTGIDVTGTAVTDGLTVDTAIATSTASFRATSNSTTIGQKIGSLDFFNGTTNAAGTLEVRRASGGNAYSDVALMASANGNRSNQLLLSTNGDISFYEDTGTTAKFFWDASAESLGIGTASPGATLDISDAFAAVNLESSTGTNQVQVKVSNTGGGAFFGRENSAGSWFGTGEAYATTLRSDGAYPMIFRVNGGNRLVLDDGGNVGLGVTPSAWGSGSTAFQLGNGAIWKSGNRSVDWITNGYYNGTNYIYNVSNAATFYRQYDGSHQFYTAPSGTAGNAISFTQAMTLDSSGNLLVGKTSIGINGEGFEATASGYIAAVRDGGTAAYFQRKTSDGEIVNFRKDGTTVGSIGAYAGDSYIGTGVAGLRFYDAGPAVSPHNTTTNLGTDGAIDLGTSAGRFKDLYLSGGAYLGGTAAANKLDDYEEGTWTPTINSGTITVVDARYTKIGRLVQVSANLGDISDNTSALNINIGGLPFTSSADNRGIGSAMFRYFTKTNAVQMNAYMGENTTILNFYWSFNANTTWDVVEFVDGAAANMDIIFTVTYTV